MSLTPRSTTSAPLVALLSLPADVDELTWLLLPVRHPVRALRRSATWKRAPGGPDDRLASECLSDEAVRNHATR